VGDGKSVFERKTFTYSLGVEHALYGLLKEKEREGEV
jgi:hypothetical protein